MNKALILIDIQNDFLPGGALPVPGGEAVLPKVGRLLTYPFDFVVATKDWHPQNHGSFAEAHGLAVGDVVELAGQEQLLWPVHCVRGTPGAELAFEGAIDWVVEKGKDPLVDSYSAFFDNLRQRATGLEAKLKEAGVDEVYLAGLATDYCVLATALDAALLGFRVWVIVDACAGIERQPGDVKRALKEMRAAGVLLDTVEGVEGKFSL